MKLKRFLHRVLPSRLYEKIRDHHHSFFQCIGTKSIEQALREQRLFKLAHKLSEIIPDITRQYSTFKLNTFYLTTKVRAQHAFQISLVQEAIKILGNNVKDDLTVVDIGDSAGTHIQYIKRLFGDQIRSISVNLDAEAVKRIREKGFEAICARAEEVGEKYSINADTYSVYASNILFIVSG